MNKIMNLRMYPSLVLLLVGLFLLSGCGSGGSETVASDPDPVPDSLESATVTGTLQEQASTTTAFWRLLSPVAAHAVVPSFVYLDDSNVPVSVAADDGRFRLSDLADGDHTLSWDLATGETLEFPFRMVAGRGLDFGTIRYTADGVEEFTGFNGYHFGYVDADGDGVNDNFVDADGDGICDERDESGERLRFAGYGYLQQFGYVDVDPVDGINDRFIDADGDGFNDRNGQRVGYGFGWVDADDDGFNDHFRDSDGNGIDDISGVPFSHGFGYVDVDPADGKNDLFVDEKGDGFNDRNGQPYVAMPGWVDLNNIEGNDFFADANGDGINDRFIDSDGDTVNDLAAMSYGHGFGWVDADGDGFNDRFVDADGDGINDLNDQSARGYGFHRMHTDTDGNGIDDIEGTPFRHGFGWIDEQEPSADVNDLFVDDDGDGVNDLYGMGYGGRYMMVSGFGQMPAGINWPMGMGHGMGRSF